MRSFFCKNKKKKGRMPGKTWRIMKKFIEIKLVSDIGLCLKNFFVPLLYFLMEQQYKKKK